MNQPTVSDVNQLNSGCQASNRRYCNLHGTLLQKHRTVSCFDPCRSRSFFFFLMSSCRFHKSRATVSASKSRQEQERQSQPPDDRGVFWGSNESNRAKSLGIDLGLNATKRPDLLGKAVVKGGCFWRHSSHWAPTLQRSSRSIVVESYWDML